MIRKIAIASLVLFSMNSLASDVKVMDGAYHCVEDHLVSIVNDKSVVNTPRSFVMKVSGGLITIKESEQQNVPYMFFNIVNYIRINDGWIRATKGLFNEFMLSGEHFKWVYSRNSDIATKNSALTVSQGTCTKI